MIRTLPFSLIFLEILIQKACNLRPQGIFQSLSESSLKYSESPVALDGVVLRMLPVLSPVMWYYERQLKYMVPNEAEKKLKMRI